MCLLHFTFQIYDLRCANKSTSSLLLGYTECSFLYAIILFICKSVKLPPYWTLCTKMQLLTSYIQKFRLILFFSIIYYHVQKLRIDTYGMILITTGILPIHFQHFISKKMLGDFVISIFVLCMSVYYMFIVSL